MFQPHIINLLSMMDSAKTLKFTIDSAKNFEV
jgi:hypothetical protein